jgi:glycosyltransferase involved in cell wall biosynthesis
MEDIISIIFIHHARNKSRSELGMQCFKNLYETVKHLPVEMIVIDNGGSLEDSTFFLKEAEENRITYYIRNSSNLWFGHARNQGLAISQGKYICITDNDITFQNGWLEKCIDILKATIGQKHLVTPLRTDTQHRYPKYERDPVEVNGITYETNAMAGSSCWVMRKEDADAIGLFEEDVKAGTIWSRQISRRGYSVIVFPAPPYAGNLGTKDSCYSGYEGKKGKQPDIIKKLINGKEICLNCQL